MDGSSSQINFSFVMHLDQQHCSLAFSIKNKYFSRCNTSTGITETLNMHTVFYELLYRRQSIILCYEVFEHNDIETTAAHFLKKVRWLS